MNGQPHTHKIEIHRRYGTASGPIEVTYGDTRVSTLGRWGRALYATKTNSPSDRRVRKAVAKAIRRHDEGSLRAGAEETRLAELRAQVADLPPDRWASEIL